MRGISWAKIGEVYIDIGLDYCGGTLDIDDISYYTDQDTAPVELIQQRLIVHERLMQFTSEQLANAILDIIENARKG